MKRSRFTEEQIAHAGELCVSDHDHARHRQADPGCQPPHPCVSKQSHVAIFAQAPTEALSVALRPSHEKTVPTCAVGRRRQGLTVTADGHTALLPACCYVV